MSFVDVRALVKIAVENPGAKLVVYSPEEGCVDLWSDVRLDQPAGVRWHESESRFPPGWRYWNVDIEETQA